MLLFLGLSRVHSCSAASVARTHRASHLILTTNLCSLWCLRCPCAVYAAPGLHMFSLSQDPLTPAAAWMRLLPSSCLAIPDVLVHAPVTQQQQQQQHSEAGSGEQQGQEQLSGLLLVGSKCSSSQVLGLSRACWEAATVAWSGRQGDCSLPVLQSALQPSVAGAQAVAVYQDPSGASRFPAVFPCQS